MSDNRICTTEVSPVCDNDFSKKCQEEENPMKLNSDFEDTQDIAMTSYDAAEILGSFNPPITIEEARKALEENHGSMAYAAAALGIPFRAFRRAVSVDDTLGSEFELQSAFALENAAVEIRCLCHSPETDPHLRLAASKTVLDEKFRPLFTNRPIESAPSCQRAQAAS